MEDRCRKDQNQISRDENYSVWDETFMDGIKSRLDTAEKKIHKLENKLFNRTQKNKRKIYRTEHQEADGQLQAT